jgi:hypothetical protein
METTILNDISFVLDNRNMESLKKHMKIQESGPSYDVFLALIKEAGKIARPKGLYGPAYIEDRTKGSIMVEGRRLTSSVLAVNLMHVERIFIFVATCGLELDEWARDQKNVLHAYWAGAIKEMALRTAIKTLRAHLGGEYHPGQTSLQTPGSLTDFPLTEQENLFALLGDTKTAVGVTLLESLMMSPSHSVSGIIFPTTVNFESCMLCPRENCPRRRASYDQDLYERKYSQSAGEVVT